MVGRFVRRRNRIPDQVSSISASEQARLLNDPAVPLEEESTAAPATETITRIDQKQPNQRRIVQTLLEDSKAA